MNSNAGLVSILMPAYNCENFIQQAIDSILNQTYQNFELLISDDGSNDNTKNIIDAYTDSRIVRRHNPKNLGYLETSNILVKIAQGEFITFQDADDYAHPYRLEFLLEELKKNDSLMAVGSFARRVSEIGEELNVIDIKTKNEDIKKDLPAIINCIGSAVIVRRKVIDELGLYHKFFDRIGSEDLYWFGLIASKYEVMNLDKALYYYRINSASVSNDKLPSLKKQMSKEYAILGISYFQDKGKVLFDNSYRLKVLTLFMKGKALLWRNKFFNGIFYICISIILNPFVYAERFKLIKMYLPKLFRLKKTNIA